MRKGRVALASEKGRRCGKCSQRNEICGSIYEGARREYVWDS